MGGASKCPGETFTSATESILSMYIVHNCGPNNDQLCTSTWLNGEDNAYFNAVILNQSPTGEFLFIYLFIFSNQFKSNRNFVSCVMALQQRTTTGEILGSTIGMIRTSDKDFLMTLM